MENTNRLTFKKLSFPLTILVVFWVIAIGLWQWQDKIFYVFNFGYIGTSIAVGIGLYDLLPKKQKHWARRLAQFLVGTYMLVYLGFVQRENMQVEGFFFYVLSGLFAGSVLHYLIAKVIGPVIFGRGWCSWACWITMVLDLLPFKRNKAGRLPEKFGWIRYIHFVLSLALVLILWFVFGYSDQNSAMAPLYWLIAGNLLYYGIGIVLAYALKDNRAFCKYVCPIPTIQKITSRLSLLKIKGAAEDCIGCGACDRACPMDIKVSEYTQQGKRVLSTECVICNECVNACRKDVLSMSFGFDFGKEELLNFRK